MTLSHQRRFAGNFTKCKEKQRVWLIQLLIVSGNVQRLPNSRNAMTRTGVFFDSRQNCSSKLAARVAGGNPFQARAAATGNDRSPRVERHVTHISECRRYMRVE